MTQTQRLTEIRRNLSTLFSDDEIRTLLFDLGLDYDSLPAIGKDGKVRELLALVDRKGLLSQLISLCRLERPKIAWQEIADADKGPAESPFKGLEFFDIADAALFFGREQLTAKLIGQLRQERFLAIVGASGSGKSSLVRAGVAATLLAGGSLADGTRPPQGSDRWLVRIMTPTAQPIEALASQLVPTSEPISNLADFIQSAQLHPNRLHLQATRQLAQVSQATGRTRERMLLIIDQFEEVFTLCRDDAQRQAFINNLLYAAKLEGSPVTVVLTMRADFYAQCAAFDDLRDMLAKHQDYIGPMKRDELKRAIEEPAKLSGYEFEPGLVETLLRDAGDEPGALPLLSHALLETWKAREGRTLTLQGYVASGGLRGAIAKTADDVYASFNPHEQAITRTIFLRLTELGEGVADTRRRVRLDELIPRPEDIDVVKDVLRRLATQDARLVTTSAEDLESPLGKDMPSIQPVSVRREPSPYVEVAHEALIREWQRLRGWLDEDRDALRTHRQLTEAAEMWTRLHRDEGALYRGIQLAQASEWATRHGEEMNAQERDFLNTSRAVIEREVADREAQQQRELEAAQKLAETESKRAEAAQRLADTESKRADEQQRSSRKLRNLLVLVTMVALVAAGFAGWAIWQTRQAQIATDQAETNLTIAQNQRTLGRSREIAALVISQIATGQDPERVLLLAMEAVTITHSADLPHPFEAEDALRQALFLPRVRALLLGHEGPVTSAQFSPDGKHIVTASWDKTARVWEAATGKQTALLLGHEARVKSAQFSPDGKHIVTASYDGTARVWEAATGKQTALLAGHESPVNSAQFSPDGQRIVTASDDKTARVWEAATGKQTALLAGHESPVNSAQFSPDGQRIVTASDETARVWETATGKQIALLSGHEFWVTSAQFSPDGQRIVTASGDKTARVWETATGKQIALLSGHEGSVTSAQFSPPDGKHIVTASDDKTARIWEAATGKQTALLAGHEGPVYSAQFSPDGNHIVTASSDNTSRVWEAATGKQTALLAGHEGVVTSAQFSPDGKHIVTASQDRTARIWEAATGKQTALLAGHEGPVTSAQFSPDGQQIVTASIDKTARIWEAATGKQTALLAGHEGTVYSAQFSPDSQHIVTTSDDGAARVWEAATGKQTALLAGHEGPVYSAQFSPDGNHIVTASDDNTSRVWEAAIGKQTALLAGHTDRVTSAQFSPDGKHIVTASDDKTARVWEADTGKQIALLAGHEGPGPVYRAQFSPDGQHIVTASQDKTARVWETASGKQTALLAGHEGPVYSAQFSPDGQHIVTTSDDKTARVWEAATGKQTALLAGHEGPVYSAQFSPDGKHIVTASDDKTARVWEAATGKQTALLAGHEDGVTSAQFSPDGQLIVTASDVTASSDRTARIYWVKIDDLMALAKSRVTRQLSCQERVKYLSEALDCSTKSP